MEEIRRIIRGTIGVLVDPYDQGKIMTGVNLMIGAAGVVLAVALPYVKLIQSECSSMVYS